MNNIELKNLNHEKPSQPYDFHIDRSTPLGNPYSLINENYRDQICDQYEKYFQKMLKNKNTKFNVYLENIKKCFKKHKKIRLFCWCVPKRCHGETIKKWLEKQLEK